VKLRLTGAMIAATVLLVNSSPGFGLAQSAPPTPRVVQGAIALSIVTDKARYGIGEPILLKVAMKNGTGNNYAIVSRYVTEMVALTIRDTSGQVILRQAPPQSPGYPTMPVAVDFPRGASQTLIGVNQQEWQSLSSWGYGSLAPGRYTITGVLQASVRQYESGEQGRIVDRFATSDENGNGSHASVTIVIDAK
jgi:hypothetical protein